MTRRNRDDDMWEACHSQRFWSPNGRSNFGMIVRMFVSGRVLGIDPGLTRCGYAVIDAAGSDTRAVSLGVLRTPADESLAGRLARLHLDFEDLLREFSPESVAVEQVFFQANVRTAMSVGQASGLILALAHRNGCSVVQYTPNQVKEAVTGWGGAGKAQVQKMVQVRLALSAPPRPADAADAAALALCHLAMAPMHQRLIAAGAPSVMGRARSRRKAG
jgi:crossover junction endodeoxyribonuclease RuvC